MLELPDNLLSADAAMALLSDIERRSHAAAARLPESSAVRDVWDGLYSVSPACGSSRLWTR